MRNIVEKFVCAVCLIGTVSFANASQAYTWQDIKQKVEPTVSKSVKEAYLKVYTKEEAVNDGGYLWVRGPRYSIFSDKGKLIRTVTNESGTPNTFSLLPGKYVIVPDGRQYKKEIIGAILEPGRLTEIHMMGG